MPKITIHHPDGEESRLELKSGLITVGRAPDNDVLLPDGSSSGNHAVFKKTADGDFSVTDLGSTNHTRVNGSKVQTFDLQDGDVILFGDTKVTYHSEISAGRGGTNRPGGESPAPPPAPSHRKLSTPQSFSAEEKRLHGAATPAGKRAASANPADEGVGAGGCFALLMLPMLLALCLFAGMAARHYFATDRKLLHQELLQLYSESRAEKAAAQLPSE